MNTASPALRLFAKYCEFGPTTQAWSARFKAICFCSNLEELGVPASIAAYNAKPILIRRTGSLHRGQGYIEMNVHVHKFANLAKQSIHFLSSRFGQMAMQVDGLVDNSYYTFCFLIGLRSASWWRAGRTTSCPSVSSAAWPSTDRRRSWQSSCSPKTSTAPTRKPYSLGGYVVRGPRILLRISA